VKNVVNLKRKFGSLDLNNVTNLFFFFFLSQCIVLIKQSYPRE